MESVPPCNSTSRLAIVKPQPKSLLFLHLAVELHISADAPDLLGGKSAALVADGQRDAVERSASVTCTGEPGSENLKAFCTSSLRPC
jgi:hypothetical protein